MRRAGGDPAGDLFEVGEQDAAAVDQARGGSMLADTLVRPMLVPLFILSAVMFAGSLALMPVLLVRMPADYFARGELPFAGWRQRREGNSRPARSMWRAPRAHRRPSAACSASRISGEPTPPANAVLDQDANPLYARFVPFNSR